MYLLFDSQTHTAMCFLFKLNKFMVMLFFYFGLWYPPKGREIGHWIHYCPHTYANAPLNCLKLLIIECKQCDKQDFFVKLIICHSLDIRLVFNT